MLRISLECLEAGFTDSGSTPPCFSLVLLPALFPVLVLSVPACFLSDSDSVSCGAVGVTDGVLPHAKVSRYRFKGGF